VTFTKEDLVCLARQLPGLLSSRYKPQTWLGANANKFI
jgi:hypothetical protein